MFDFAIQMEKDAESLYLELADRTSNSGIKRVFTMLAGDEARHRKVIEKLQKKLDTDPEKGSALEIKTVFDEMKSNFRNIHLDDHVVKDYELALEIEKKGVEYYKKQFEGAKDGKTKKLYEVLMKQESYHLMTVENLVDMVRKPEWWVENAEFNPKGDNYY